MLIWPIYWWFCSKISKPGRQVHRRCLGRAFSKQLRSWHVPSRFIAANNMGQLARTNTQPPRPWTRISRPIPPICLASKQAVSSRITSAFEVMQVPQSNLACMALWRARHPTPWKCFKKLLYRRVTDHLGCRTTSSRWKELTNMNNSNNSQTLANPRGSLVSNIKWMALRLLQGALMQNVCQITTSQMEETEGETRRIRKTSKTMSNTAASWQHFCKKGIKIKMLTSQGQACIKIKAKTLGQRRGHSQPKETPVTIGIHAIVTTRTRVRTRTRAAWNMKMPLIIETNRMSQFQHLIAKAEHISRKTSTFRAETH